MTRIRPRLLLLVAAVAILISWYAALMVSYVRVPGNLKAQIFWLSILPAVWLVIMELIRYITWNCRGLHRHTRRVSRWDPSKP